jgi:predicted dehydrogenase
MTRTLLVMFLFIAVPVLLTSCAGPKDGKPFTGAKGEVRLMTLDPGHFHAALIQKAMYEQVAPEVYVYAPEGAELAAHLKLVEGYNTRSENPTHWQEKVYTGTDYLQKMIQQKPGNVMVTAGNNAKKTEYLKAAVDAGINVLADKPMCIDEKDFELLKECFASAQKNGVLLYDVMTERSEITTLLQKELAQIPEVFGQLTAGTTEQPAITKESVHNYFKEVSGKPLQRPAWFYDVTQQGEGIVDVTTHLLDLVMWEAFPDQAIDYKSDIELVAAKRWPTMISMEQFTRSTKLSEWPDYLQKYVDAKGALNVYCNGEINYRLKGVHAKVSVIWNFQAPPGGGDTHYSIMRGTKADAIIQQGAEEKYKPELYLAPAKGVDMKTLAAALEKAVASLQAIYPGIGIEAQKELYKITIPDKYRIGHEAHFGQVAQRYLKYLVDGHLPAWEVPNMLAKYWTTTQALTMAKK